MKNHLPFIDTHVQNAAGSMSLFILIIKAANTTNTDNDISKFVFCTKQEDIRMRPEIEQPENKLLRCFTFALHIVDQGTGEVPGWVTSSSGGPSVVLFQARTIGRSPWRTLDLRG